MVVSSRRARSATRCSSSALCRRISSSARRRPVMSTMPAMAPRYVLVGGGSRLHHDVAVRAALVQQLEVVLFLDALPATSEVLPGTLPVLFVHEVEQMPPHHFFRGIAQHPGHGRVDEGGDGVLIDDPDALLSQFDELPVFALAFLQGLLGLPALGDVADEDEDLVAGERHVPGFEEAGIAVQGEFIVEHLRRAGLESTLDAGTATGGQIGRQNVVLPFSQKTLGG